MEELIAHLENDFQFSFSKSQKRSLALRGLSIVNELDQSLERWILSRDDKGEDDNRADLGIFVIGSWESGFGGFGKHLALDQSVKTIYFSPFPPSTNLHNDHIDGDEKIVIVDDELKDEEAIVSFLTSHRNEISLTIITSLPLLKMGMVESLSGKGFLCFGPTSKGCIVETSQTFCLTMLQNLGIKTHPFLSTSSFSLARNFIMDCWNKNDGMNQNEVEEFLSTYKISYCGKAYYPPLFVTSLQSLNDLFPLSEEDEVGSPPTSSTTPKIPSFFIKKPQDDNQKTSNIPSSTSSSMKDYPQSEVNSKGTEGWWCKTSQFLVECFPFHKNFVHVCCSAFTDGTSTCLVSQPLFVHNFPIYDDKDNKESNDMRRCSNQLPENLVAKLGFSRRNETKFLEDLSRSFSTNLQRIVDYLKDSGYIVDGMISLFGVMMEDEEEDYQSIEEMVENVTFIKVKISPPNLVCESSFALLPPSLFVSSIFQVAEGKIVESSRRLSEEDDGLKSSMIVHSISSSSQDYSTTFSCLNTFQSNFLLTKFQSCDNPINNPTHILLVCIKSNEGNKEEEEDYISHLILPKIDHRLVESKNDQEDELIDIIEVDSLDQVFTDFLT